MYIYIYIYIYIYTHIHIHTYTPLPWVLDEGLSRSFVHPLPAPDRVCGSSGALSGSAIP